MFVTRVIFTNILNTVDFYFIICKGEAKKKKARQLAIRGDSYRAGNVTDLTQAVDFIGLIQVYQVFGLYQVASNL